MHVGTREDPLHRAILRRETSIPAWNRQEFHFSCILPIAFHLCLRILLYLYISLALHRYANMAIAINLDNDEREH